MSEFLSDGEVTPQWDHGNLILTRTSQGPRHQSHDSYGRLWTSLTTSFGRRDTFPHLQDHERCLFDKSERPTVQPRPDETVHLSPGGGSTTSLLVGLEPRFDRDLDVFKRLEDIGVGEVFTRKDRGPSFYLFRVEGREVEIKQDVKFLTLYLMYLILDIHFSFKINTYWGTLVVGEVLGLVKTVGSLPLSGEDRVDHLGRGVLIGTETTDSSVQLKWTRICIFTLVCHL